MLTAQSNRLDSLTENISTNISTQLEKNNLESRLGLVRGAYVPNDADVGHGRDAARDVRDAAKES